jgi:multidrug efflux system outer membrane protein
MKTPFLPVLASCLCAAGCLSTPSRNAAPTLRSSAPVVSVEATAQARWPVAEWWRQYGDADLNQLIARALAGSPDLAAAQARFEQASASVRLAAAAAGLRVDATAQLARQRLSDNGLLPPRLLGFNWYSTADLGLDARYSFDWWGRLAASKRAADSDLRAAGAERDAAALALASSVAEVYFGWQADTARVEVAQGRRAELERDLRIVRAQTRADIASGEEVERVTVELLDATDRHGTLESSRRLRLVTLAALLGCTPDELPPLKPATLPLIPADLPADVSLNLMSRRPDLQQRRRQIESAAANLDVARAGFFPDISLSALLGLSSRELGNLLESGSLAPKFTVAVNLPLFDSGRLRALHDREQARVGTAVAEYNAALIAAAREVNGELVERSAWSGQLKLRDAQLTSNARLQSLAEERLVRGVTDARPVVRARLGWLAAEDARLVTRYELLKADLALIRALGGGYDTGN